MPSVYGMSARCAGVCLALLTAACGAEPAPASDAEVSEGPEPTRAAMDNSRDTFDAPPLPDNEINAGDADGDHIRDDIETYIDAEFGDDEMKRLSARQGARAIQHQLAYAQDKDKALDAADEFMRSFACMSAAGHEAGDTLTELEAQAADTLERFDAYVKYNLQMGGHTFILPPSKLENCDFDMTGMAP